MPEQPKPTIEERDLMSRIERYLEESREPDIRLAVLGCMRTILEPSVSPPAAAALMIRVLGRPWNGRKYREGTPEDTFPECGCPGRLCVHLGSFRRSPTMAAWTCREVELAVEFALRGRLGGGAELEGPAMLRVALEPHPHAEAPDDDNVRVYPELSDAAGRTLAVHPELLPECFVERSELHCTAKFPYPSALDESQGTAPGILYARIARRERGDGLRLLGAYIAPLNPTGSPFGFVTSLRRLAGYTGRCRWPGALRKLKAQCGPPEGPVAALVVGVSENLLSIQRERS